MKMVRTKEELIAEVQNVIGENLDDNAIALIEDIINNSIIKLDENFKTTYI